MSAAVAGADDAVAREYLAIVAGLPGGGGDLRARRDESLRRFLDRGWPGPRDEAWRFCDLRPLRGIAFSHRPAPAFAPDAAAHTIFSGAAHRLVFVNGHLVSPAEPGDAGRPRLTGLAGDLAGDGAWVLERLGGVERAEDHPFTFLNGALWADGAAVRIPRGIRLERPIHLLFLSTGAAAPLAVHPRILVVVEEGAEAVLVEEYATAGGATVFHNPVVEVAVEAGASLAHARLLRERPEDFHIGSVSVRVDRDARYRGISVALGGRIARSDIHLHLAGEGAEGRLNGLYAVSGRQLVDHHIRVDHAAPRTTSDQLMKGVLSGRSRGVFSGLIRIRAGSQRAAAEQVNQNLLLSDDALVHTHPQLEILADDVTCRHGATIGQLDEDRLFYLRSRGLAEATARRLLVNAFADEVLDRLEPVELRDALVRRLSEETFRDV